MHICFLTNEYPTEGKPQGGIGSFVYTLAHKLIDNGVAVTVMGLYDVEKEEISSDDGITIIRLPQSRRKTFQFVANQKIINAKLKQLSEIDKPIDILEGPELSFAFMSRKAPFKKVIRMHGGHHFFAVTLGKKPAVWRSWQEKQSFKNADNVCAVSNYVSQTTKDLLNLSCPIETIYNPVDLKDFYQADPSQARKHTILFVGTVCEKKGVRQLIQSLKFLIDKYPDLHLNIAGRDWSNGNIPSYIALLKRDMPSDLMRYVSFLGPVDHAQIPPLIETTEICVFPSLMESFGIAWIEALAMGKPLVGSKIGPAPEIFKEGETGLLCNPYSPESIAEKISYFFDNKEVAIKIGERARLDVIDRFSVDTLVQQNINFYKNCLK